MARIRTIKPELFRHEKLFDAERNTKLPLRLSFAGLFTAADREGRFVWSPRALKLDCLPYDNIDFEQVLDALCEYGFIIKYEIDGKFYGAIPSWKQHQHVNLRESVSSIPDPSDASICTHVQACGEGNGRELEGKGNNIRAVADATHTELDSDFEEFWKEKPKRKGANPKSEAKKAFFAAVKAGADPKEIVAAARQWARDDTEKIGTEFIPMAVTWIRQRRHDDLKPDPVDAEKQAAIERDMAVRGYVWTNDQWVKNTEVAA